MNPNSISNQLLYTTARLTAYYPTKTETSTGFLATVTTTKGLVPFLITCSHGVDNADAIEMALTRADNGLPKLGVKEQFKLSKSDLLAAAHVDRELDICAIPFGPVLNHFENKGAPLFVKPIGFEIFPTDQQRSELNALEELVFVGYPKGLHDEVNLLPIFRKGVSASPIWVDFRNAPKFLIDAEVFPGSSGSPVFVLNEGSYATPNGLNIGTRLYFVGMIAVQLNDKASGEHIGLGVALSAKAIRKHLEEAAAILTRE